MRCERCNGKGRIDYIRLGFDYYDEAGAKMPVPSSPCPDCNGSGIGHCCDGLQAQCEREE